MLVALHIKIILIHQLHRNGTSYTQAQVIQQGLANTGFSIVKWCSFLLYPSIEQPTISPHSSPTLKSNLVP